METPWTILCFAGVDWASHRQRPQQVMSSFADRGADVLYIDNLGTRLPRFSDAGRVARRLGQWARTTWTPTRPDAAGRGPSTSEGSGEGRGADAADRAGGRVRTDAPIVLPLQHLAPVRALGRATLARRLRRRLGTPRPLIAWTYLPMPVIGDVATDLGADLLVYDWSDDASQHVLSPSQAHRHRIAGWEDAMVRRADLVFVASAELLRRRGSSNPRTFVIPHGAPRPTAGPLRTPPEIAELPRPRVGFVGSITEWTDLDLVDRLAGARPDWSFVMVGPVKVRVDGLARRKNVVFTGQRPHEEIPALLDAFDAAIIPYRITPATTAASPVKLREYLASGLPVVSVDIPEARDVDPLVEVASDPESFLAAMDRAVATPRRIGPTGGRSWDDRVEEMAGHVAEALGDR